MIELKPTKYGDFDKIKMKDCYSGDPTLTSRHNNLIHAAGVYTHTLIDSKSGLVIGVVGGSLCWPGVLRIWAVFGEEVKNYAISFFKMVVFIINEYIKRLKLWRVEFTVREDFKQGVRWAKALGFSCEGKMVKYGPDGSDHYLYARII